MIRTAIVTVFLTLYTLVVAPPLILHALLTGNPDLLFRVGSAGAYFSARLVGLKIKVEGHEKIPAGTCLFLANHTSFVDPVPIVWAIHRRIAILLKRSLLSIPIVGWAFRIAKFVPVDRSNRGSAIASIDLAAERMKQGLSFLAYPEGTRSYDGRLLPFKKGVFVLAIKAQAQIVPMVLIGAQRIAPKGSLRISPGEVTVRFGDQIDASTYTITQRRELADRVHAAMAALLPPDQQPLKL
jgi:1-acyl-sn-glycerol-3-phosphate acyltransferase|nr:lysophospholipid acyltransferase family protein [Candidatus Acidoferrales bacterium]